MLLMRPSLLVPVTVGLSVMVPVYAIEPPPDAGRALRGIEQRPLPLPSRPTLDLNLTDAPTTTPQSGGPVLSVKGFAFSGNQVIATNELLSLMEDLKNRDVSLGELQAGAHRVTELYHRRGYPLARAYLPAQDVEGGVIQIAVLEGRFGQIQVDNRSRLGSSALAPLAELKAGDIVQADGLERSLLLFNDTPGVEVKSTLKPGATVGTTDLQVDVQPGALVSGSIDADNYGNRFTGEYRFGGSLYLNSPLGLGDRLSLRGLNSDEDQHYTRAAYQLPVGPWSTQVGVAYSDMDYQLVKDFSDLNAHGNARITSLFAIQPLIRSRDLSVYAQLQFDDKRLKDDIELFSSKSDKHSRVWTAVLNGNSRDDLAGGGVNSFSLAWSHGRLNIDGARNQLIDDLSAGSRGQFNTFVPELVRLQRLSERWSLYTQLQAQLSDSNLDSSEKLSLGGAYGVRAYPQGEASGDEGWLANLELRYALTEAWQLAAFVDHGEVRLNKEPWSDEDNHRSLSATGLGATWNADGWQVHAIAAWKLGNAEPQSDVDRTPRVWAQIVRSF